jgi:hypothetical protein
MSFLLASRPLGIGLGLGAAFTSYSLLRPRRNLYALCDSSATLNSYTNNAKVPVVTRRGGLNPNAVRQISSGSIAGMLLLLSIKNSREDAYGKQVFWVVWPYLSSLSP